MDLTDDIKTRRVVNSTLPINALPPEVLLLVFKLYSVFEWRGGDVPWIKVTHTCYAWRDIALSSATLWNRIRITNSTSTSRVVTWLERSQQVPLTIIALPLSIPQQDTPHRRQAIYRSIFQHFSRIQELEILLPEEQLYALDWPEAPADQLKELSIFESGVSLDQEPSPTDWHVPSRITEFSQLTSLSTRSVSLRLNAWRFPTSLIHLNLWDSASLTPTTLDRMLNILSELPLLESLGIGRALLGTDTFPVSADKTVALPYLRQLSISEHLLLCSELIAHLTVPQGTKHRFNIILTEHSITTHLSAAASSIMAWSRRVMEPAHHVSFRFESEAEFESPGNNVFFMAGQNLTYRFNGPLWHSHADVVINLEEEETDALFFDVSLLDTFYNGLDFTAVTTVHVETDDEASHHPHLLKSFGAMLNVTELHVHGHDFTIIIACLCLLNGEHYGAYLFPKLRNIYLDALWCGEGCLPTFRQLLQIRRQRGMPVERLFITLDEEISVEDVNNVFEDVVAVEWLVKQRTSYDVTAHPIDLQATMESIRELTHGMDVTEGDGDAAE